MNEHAKSKLHKLADQCKHPDNYHQGPWMDYIQFAELIVKECASLFDGVYTDQQRPQKIDLTIKQHFGVER